MARGFLIFLNIIVVLLYLAIYIFLEPLLQMVEQYITLSPLMLTALRFFLLVVIGFCMGNLTQVFTRTDYDRTYWDVKSFVLLSIIPAIFLVGVSLGPVTDLLSQLPVIKESPSEFLFYLMSSRYIWMLWIGFNLGASIKFPQFYAPRRRVSK